MKMTLAAVTALTGGLFLAPFMLGPSQAGSAPDLKNSIGATHDGAITLVRSGGGGGGGGHGAGSGGAHANAAVGGGQMSARSASVSHGNVSAQASTGHRSTSSQSVSHWIGNHSHNRHFANGGYYGSYPYDYGDDCYSLRRYSWARYQACMGIY
jgi:hypothetical protein